MAKKKTKFEGNPKEQRLQIFEAKRANRKLGKELWTRMNQRQEGRRARKTLAHNGAFGLAPASIYNLCIQGTSETSERKLSAKEQRERGG